MTENAAGGISIWRAMLLLASVVCVAVVCIAAMHGEADLSVLEEETELIGAQTVQSMPVSIRRPRRGERDDLMQERAQFHFWPGASDKYIKEHPNQDPKKAEAAEADTQGKLMKKVKAQVKANATGAVIVASTAGHSHYNVSAKGNKGVQSTQREILLKKWMGIKVAAQAVRKNSKLAKEIKKKKKAKAQEGEKKVKSEKKSKSAATANEKKSKKSLLAAEKQQKKTAVGDEKKSKKSSESDKKNAEKKFQERHDKALAAEVKSKHSEKSTKEAEAKASKKAKATHEKHLKESESKAKAQAKKAPCPKKKATEKATKLQLKNAEERVVKEHKSAQTQEEKSADEVRQKIAAQRQKMTQSRLGHYWPWERKKKGTLRALRARLGIDVSKSQVLARQTRKVADLNAEQHEKIAAREVSQAAKKQATDEVNSKLAARQQTIVRRQLQRGTNLLEEQTDAGSAASPKRMNPSHTPTDDEIAAQAATMQRDYEAAAADQKTAALAAMKVHDVLVDAKGKVATAEALRQADSTRKHLSKAELQQYSNARVAMAKAMTDVRNTALKALHIKNRETVDMKEATKQQFVLSQMKAQAREAADDAVADSAHERYVTSIAGMATEMLNFKTKAEHDADNRVDFMKNSEAQASREMQMSDPLVQSVLAAKKLYLRARAEYSATVSQAKAALQVLQAAQINERDGDATSEQLGDVKRLGSAVLHAQASLQAVGAEMEKAQERAEMLRNLYVQAHNAVQNVQQNPGAVQSVAQEVARQQALSKMYARRQMQQHADVDAAAQRQVEWRRIANHAVQVAQERQPYVGWSGVRGETEQLSHYTEDASKDTDLVKALPELADTSMNSQHKSELHTDTAGFVLPDKLAHELGSVMKEAEASEDSAWSHTGRLPKATLRGFVKNDPLDPTGDKHQD